MMNSEYAPTEATRDVFKPFREAANSFDSVQVERFSRMRNKVVESLKVSVESRRLSMSLSPNRKRGKDREEEEHGKQKMQNSRLSPKNDHRSSGLPLKAKK